MYLVVIGLDICLLSEFAFIGGVSLDVLVTLLAVLGGCLQCVCVD